MALTRKISSGGTVANFSTYVGEKGHLFYNSDTGDLRISDGVTIGGNSLTLTSSQLGDLHIYGSNITTVNANEDLNLISNGTGNVNVYGNFKVYTDGLNSTVSFNAAPTGLLTINAPSPVPSGSSGALNIVGSTDGSYQAVHGIGGMIHVTGNQDASVRITLDGYTTSATAPQNPTSTGAGLISMRSSRGTPASPLPTQANDILGGWAALGQLGTGGFSQQQNGIVFYAADTFTTSSTIGTYANLYLTPPGTGTAVTAVRFNAGGIVTGTVGSTDTTNSTSTTTGAITTAGGLGVAQDAWIGGSLWVSNNYTSYVGSVGNGSSLTLQGGADAQGAVSVKTNSFSVTTTTLTTPAVQTNSLGHTTFTDLDPGSIAPTVVITGNTDSSTQPPQTGGVQLHVTGDVGMPGRIYNDGQADYAVLVNRRYNGTSTSPTAVLNTQIIGRIGATPYTSAGWPTISTARIDFVATEDQTGTNQGNAIDFYTIPNGSTTPQLSLQVANTGIISLANFLPSTDNTYNLGSSTQRWKNIYIGPGTIYITDQTLNTPVAITINNGVFNLNGIAQAQLPVLLANTVTAQSTSGTLAIGQSGDTGTLQLYRPITFSDSTVQSTAGIPLTQKGVANGVASLDGTGKVTAAQLPAGAVIFQGTWSAASNTPPLANGTGTAGYEYVVTASGTVNFGAGNITFTAGDFVIYNGSIWQRIPTGGLGVTSINGTLTGAVTGIVTTSDTGTVTNTMLAGSISNSKLSNSTITTTAGSGITLGGSSVALGGTLTITNAGVTSNVAGTGISVSGSTGAVTITNTGVTAASAGSGISLSSSTGSVTITNIGVLSNVAGTHITVSAGTGNVTIGTDATSSNTVSTIVARDSSGNFSAGTITANITGNVSGNAGTVTNGVYTTDTGTVTNTMLAGSIANNKLSNSTISGISLGSNLATLTFGTHLTGTSYNGSTGVTIATDAVSTNTASTLVARDSSGNFAANSITANRVFLGNRTVTGGASLTVDFSADSIVLWSVPTPTGGNPAAITLTNYTAGAVVRVLIRFTTAHNITMGVASANNSTTGGTTLTGTGGGAQFGANQAVELVYTCIDGTSTNTYVAASYA